MGIRSWLGSRKDQRTHPESKADDDNLVSVSLSLSKGHKFAVDDEGERQKAVRAADAAMAEFKRMHRGLSVTGDPNALKIKITRDDVYVAIPTVRCPRDLAFQLQRDLTAVFARHGFR